MGKRIRTHRINRIKKADPQPKKERRRVTSIEESGTYTERLLQRLKEQKFLDRYVQDFSSKNVLKYTVYITPEKILSVDIVYYPELSGNTQPGVIKAEKFDSLVLTINKECLNADFSKALVSVVMSRFRGAAAEIKLYEIYEKHVAHRYPFSGIVKATTKQDIYEHADFFLKYHVSAKRVKLIPIDCKAHEFAQIKGVNKNGHYYPTANLQRVKQILAGENGPDNLYQMSLILARNYLSTVHEERTTVHI